MNSKLILKNLINKILTVLSAGILLLASVFCTACQTDPDSFPVDLKPLPESPEKIIYPDYYDANSYLDKKIEKINQIAAEHQIADSFFFISDLHWECNTQISPVLVNKIRSETSVKQVILGGDYYSQDYEDVAKAKRLLSDSVSNFPDRIAIIGNHDSNNNVNDNCTGLSNHEINEIINNDLYDGEFFYTVEEENKICKLFFDCNTFNRSCAGYEEFLSFCSEYDENWNLILFVHRFFEGSKGTYFLDDKSGKIIDSLIQTELVNYNVISVFSGHIHNDYHEYMSNRYVSITTTCDACGILNTNGAIYNNTTEEQAFDVVQIDIQNSKIFLTRIGRGADRIIHYKEVNNENYNS